MKTKIIYISGNEVFEMADIRAAFEEVRSALGLGNDTVLFGVPVDSDNALAVPECAPVQSDVIATEIITAEPEIVPEPIETDCLPPAEPVVSPESEEIIDVAPVKKTRASRAKKSAVMTDSVPESEPVASSDDAPVIPILSILASNDAPASDVADMPDAGDVAPVTDDVAPAIAEIDENVATETVVISDVSIDSSLDDVAPVTDSVLESVSIGDMISDDVPPAPMEKTLEQLLESMTPLREDMGVPSHAEEEVDVVTSDADDFHVTDSDADATLAQLASEFVENQDKIVSSPKAEGHGKIGKLKNILPFKKIKRDDNGIMGDLFGWAGIAANDDDFTMPGFFTSGVAKK